MVACDKLLVTHLGALRRKYGSAGADAVRDALDALITADEARGLSSRVVLLDNASTARSLGLPRAEDGDWAAVLRLVDRAAEKYQAAYVALVGATDVVPQARVENPLADSGDPDPYVPSDLPFACDLPEAWDGTADTLLDPARLLSVTRVVGRIPDLAGAGDPALLLGTLSVSTDYRQLEPTGYQDVFALSAAAWQGSTELSVDLLPGPAPVTQLSPPATSGWSGTAVAPRLHFVNCHGADTTPDWFGQLTTSSPVDTVALTPEDIDGRVTEGTVVAAECCYGALHMDPALLGGRLPMMWAYMRSGAYAALGSSTTSYGPAAGNGQADLVCRFFLEGVLSGASTGRALLDARQRYIRESGGLGPEDLKTLCQFDLLGDPSLQPVALPGTPTAVVPKGDAAASPVLARRRAVLRATGRALDGSVPRAGRRRRRRQVEAAVLAEEAGLPQSAATDDAVTYDEADGAPRAGYRFHVAPVQRNGRRGLVVARELGGRRTARTIWRRS